MKQFKIIFIILFFTKLGYCQTGTVGDPFTTLNQALQANSAGIYFFNIGGTTFDTYADSNGYVLVAIDFGNGVGNLPQVSSLDQSSRGILDTTILASITEQSEIRISTSTGNIDATTSDATLLARISSNTTLHTGSADNAINNGWTGTGATNLTNNATGTSPTTNSLHRKIFHPSGNTNTFHWQPRINQQRELHSSGEISASSSLMLWVRDNSIALPIELLQFNVEVRNEKSVKLNWQTATEINNDYFTIERSINAAEWEQIKRIEGAGNSSTLLNYTSFDNNPHSGISYYRLKQTDYDGSSSYSPIRTANMKRIETRSVGVYPNPVTDHIIIAGKNIEPSDLKIFNVFGQDVTYLAKDVSITESAITIDLSNLKSGVYCLKTKTTTNKVYKQ